jgi:type III pantothenate kinase
MNLVIDQGNTVCKFALFEKENELVGFQICSELNISSLLQLFKEYDIQAGILSSVKEMNSDIIECLNSNISHFLFLDHTTPLPIRNAYQSPQTQGLDRLAAAAGAWSIQPGKSLLVIDMGTAITYDFIREDGTYMGGNIAPGLQMRLKALNIFTDKLPFVKPEKAFESMGTDTRTAIISGVMQGIVYEADGYFQDLQQKYSNLFAFLTGGDLFYFDGKLKNGIFACKNLVLIGLNRILHYNVHS